MPTQTFTQNGSWTCPVGVTSLQIECWGAGGGSSTGTDGEGGGGGGAYSIETALVVIPGTTYTANVGQAGTPGVAGGDTWFSATGAVLAKGGAAGSGTTGGAGGASASGVGDTKFSGGAGGDGVAGNSGGGGGGAGAGTGAVGGAGTAASGGAGGAGGIATAGGGTGGTGGSYPAGTGQKGTYPGGGSGGGSAGSNGVSGAHGKIYLTWTAGTTAASAKDLVTLARAKQSNRQITDTSFDTLYTLWITAVSEWITKYTNRYFVVQDFDEIVQGMGKLHLILKNYPIQSISSVRFNPVAVLTVKNTSTSVNQRATVQVTKTGLTLTRIASGLKVIDTSVTWDLYPTLADVATAVSALTNWTSTALGDATDFGKWPSADLYISPQWGDGVSSAGALDARGRNAELKMHTDEMTSFEFDPRGWLYRLPSVFDLGFPYSWPDKNRMGFNAYSYRVQYSAGYTTIPEAVQEAAGLWIANIWSLANRDPATANTIAATTGTGYNQVLQPPPEVISLLAPYKRRTIMGV